MSDLVQLFLMTADLNESRRFYENVLELTPDRIGDTSCSYETGACELKLQADFPADVLSEFELPQPGTDRGDGAVFVLTTDRDLDELHDHARTAAAETDGTILTVPRDVSWGGQMFLVRDPDGYVLEVREPRG